MLKKKLKWLALPVFAAIAFIGVNSFAEPDESGVKPNGKKLSGSIPCTWKCWHPEGPGGFKEYTVTGATKNECISGNPNDNCKASDETSCNGGTCSSGQAFPH